MARFGKMTDMARTPAEVKKDIAKSMPMGPASPEGATAPVYPYGLCLCLDEESLAKLGLTDLPEVGTTIHFGALGMVTSASTNMQETADGEKKPCRRVEIQVTNLAVESEDDEARDWYGEGEKKDAA